jgi:hypothetical protein
MFCARKGMKKTLVLNGVFEIIDIIVTGYNRITQFWFRRIEIVKGVVDLVFDFNNQKLEIFVNAFKVYHSIPLVLK